MKIHQIKIRNFRSIKDEVTIELNGYLSLVGPNNGVVTFGRTQNPINYKIYSFPKSSAV